MIDPTIQDKVIQAAVAAARRSRQVDLAALWEMLSKIDPTELAGLLEDSLEDYSYGALPVCEPPGAGMLCKGPASPVIGVDGSQVYPDTQDPVHWAYVQALAYAKFEPPQFSSTFFELNNSAWEASRVPQDRELSVDAVNLRRTILEMRVAAEAVKRHPDHVILMDYPLLPWIGVGIPVEDQVQEYLDNIKSVEGALIAGVVSGPKSRLLISLIALSERLHRRVTRIANVSDDILISSGLQPGQRSAIFTYAGPRNEVCKRNGVEIHFFFIRIKGFDVVRIEIPSWVSTDLDTVAKIHASILEDSLALGYPYVLAAAHENVAITLDVSGSLHSLAINTFIREGGFYYISAKQRIKTK